jgi:signal transduction histidine kinase/ActR/RegA family two-component response regulator
VTEALTGKTVKFESEFTLKSGEKRILEITYVPSQQGGEVKGVFALTHDVTERKHAELALKQNIEEMTRARAEAEKARQFAEAGNRAKDLFLATLSHELRTPLTTILSYAQMLRMGILSQDKARKGIEMIEQSAMTQAQLINDLLDISRITMGKLVLNLKEVDPVAVLRTTIESIRPQLEQKSLRIETQITPLASAVVADAVRLKQIYLNLLTNAIKFSNTGGVIEVKLDTVTENSIEYFRVSVADHGKGIHPEFLPHIFDRFRQADNSITRTHGGMGLGLAIVRALTEQHGGSALAESEGEGLGATLSIQIPLKSQQTHQDHGAIISSSALVPDSPSSMAAAIRLDGLKIVLVDDDKSARESLALLLTSLGAEVRTASSASQGYQRVLESKPDVLVSDIGMPGEDGYSLMAKVRALGLHQGGLVPSIALTAFAGIEDMQRALAAGFQAHLAKPVNASSLAKTIVGLLDPTRSSGLNH